MATVLQQPVTAGSSPFSSSPDIVTAPYSDFTLPTLPYQDSAESKQTFVHAEYDKDFRPSVPSTAPSSPQYTHSMSSRDSYFSTPSSILSLDPRESYDDDESTFPSFENNTHSQPPKTLSNEPQTPEDGSSLTLQTSSPSDSLPEAVHDDQAIEYEPTRHVDYLSHEWKEEDIWSSWRYIVSRRKQINNSVRLENASWRTWMKAKNHLKTVSPEKLNWLKDCDVTWLYGPLQIDNKSSLSRDRSPPPSQLSTSSSFLCKKPILKKKSASAAILERSRSQHSLLQRASEIIRVQQSSPVPRRPSLRRGATEFTLPSYTPSSVANTPAELDAPSTLSLRGAFGYSETPSPSDAKHVLFNEEVRQVQAVDSEEDEKDDEHEEIMSESDEDDDGGLMMAPSRSRSNRSTPRGSFSENGKTIVPLPSTTLKYRTDTPEPPERAIPATTGLWPRGNRLSPSPSQETLRPPKPSHNFLLDDDPELTDGPWSSEAGQDSPYLQYAYEAQEPPGPNMRRTESGMFMPYDENEEEAAMNNTLFGQAMYAVNTFRDIAHVVWNVGWNRNR